MADDQDKGGARAAPVAFISHHSSQEKTARHLKEILERNGIHGWMAPDDIEPGRPFDEAIVDQVVSSDLIVLLFCEKSDQSRHVKRELIMADNHKKLVYPIRLEDIDAKGLAYWLNDYQWIDWIDRRDETLQKLIDTIKRQTGIVDEPPVEPPVGADGDTIESGAAEGEAAAVTPPAKPAPAPPAPDMTTPIGLAGSGAVGGGEGAATGFRMTPLYWGIAGGGALLLLIVIVLLMAGTTDEGGRRGGGATAVALEPGRWQARFEFTDARFPNLTEQQATTARASVGNAIGNRPETITACIGSSAAANPTANTVLPADIMSGCNIASQTIADGEIAIRGTCQIPNVQGPSAMQTTGEYDATSFDSEIVFSMNNPQVGPMELVASYTAERIGDCE